MKKYKTEIKEVTVLSEHTCDICGEEMMYRKAFDSSYAVVKGAVGDVYPEADFRKHYNIDMCGECFENKLIPLIEKEFNITIKECEAD